MIQNILSRWLSGPWSIMPEAWQARQLQVKAYLDGKLPHERLLAEARPTKDLWGNPIPQMRTEHGVTIVPVHGALVKGATPFDKMVFGDVGYEDFKEDMKAAAGRHTPILMHFNSPGGMVMGSDEAADLVNDIAIGSTVYSYTEDLMASAAYKLAAPSSAIFASPSSIVGSIGTILTTFSMARMLEGAGIDVAIFQSGKLKAAGNPLKEMTPDEEAMFEANVEDLGAEFREWVSMCRSQISDDDMEGQTFTGKEAVKRGFADFNASSIEDVIEQIAGR